MMRGYGLNRAIARDGGTAMEKHRQSQENMKLTAKSEVTTFDLRF